MAITLTNIETQVRHLIGDNSTTGVDVRTYTNSNIFTLSEENAITMTTAYLNGVEMGASEMSFDSTTNKVTLTLTMISGDTVEIHYTYYPNFSSTEVQNYVQASLLHISANNYKDFIVENSSIYPEPDTREISLISAVAALIIDPDNKSYRLPDISMTLPKDIPTHEKIRRTIMIFKKNSHGIIDVL